MKNIQYLIVGQLIFVLAFIGFIFNLFIWNNQEEIALIIALFFGLSLVLNLTHLLRVLDSNQLTHE